MRSASEAVVWVGNLFFNPTAKHKGICQLMTKKPAISAQFEALSFSRMPGT